MDQPSDDVIMRLFEPLYPGPAFSPNEEVPLLAHYTSVAALENILVENKIWFSNPLFMNDLQEMRFGLVQGGMILRRPDILQKAGGTQARAQALAQYLAGYSQRLENEDAFDTYLFCLSEHKRGDTDGVLSMWRGYGQHGSGAALIFDPGKVTAVPGSPLIFATVRYGSDDERTDQLLKFVNQWAEITLSANLPDDKLHLAAYSALMALKNFALTTKHRGFSEEKERRIIYFPERDRAGLLKESLGYHIGSHGVEPKLKYEIGHLAGVSAPDLALERILDSIILGPSASSPLARRSVERMLEKIGKAQFKGKLTTSGIPLRPVSGTSF